MISNLPFLLKKSNFHFHIASFAYSDLQLEYAKNSTAFIIVTLLPLAR